MTSDLTSSFLVQLEELCSVIFRKNDTDKAEMYVEQKSSGELAPFSLIISQWARFTKNALGKC